MNDYDGQDKDGCDQDSLEKDSLNKDDEEDSSSDDESLQSSYDTEVANMYQAVANECSTKKMRESEEMRL